MQVISGDTLVKQHSNIKNMLWSSCCQLCLLKELILKLYHHICSKILRKCMVPILQFVLTSQRPEFYSEEGVTDLPQRWWFSFLAIQMNSCFRDETQLSLNYGAMTSISIIKWEQLSSHTLSFCRHQDQFCAKKKMIVNLHKLCNFLISTDIQWSHSYWINVTVGNKKQFFQL